MHISITGIDTSNGELVNNLITDITRAYPEYSSWTVNTTDTTLEILGAV